MNAGGEPRREGGAKRRRGALARHRYDRGGEKSAAAGLVERFGVHPRNPLARINELSGGNQQKVLLAKWLQQDPRVVVLHEPTQGVDVAAKGEIHRLVREFATARGAAVCIVSSDHEETADTCDRVLVMQHGRVTGELSRDELSPQRILALANA